ncbi:MAG: hypothetical protein WD512_18180 [Candidatus Paceibacterota bacterium]
MRSLKHRQKNRKTKRRIRNKRVQNGGAGIKTFLATLFLGLFLRNNTQNGGVDVDKLINEYIERQPSSAIGETNADFVNAWENMTGLNYCPPSVLSAREAERLREQRLETTRQFSQDPGGAGAGADPYVFGGPPSAFGTSSFPSEMEGEIMRNLRRRNNSGTNKRSRTDDSEKEIVERRIDRGLVEMTCDNDELLEYIKNELEIEDAELAEYNAELRKLLQRLNSERSKGKLDLSMPLTLSLVRGIISILSRIHRLASRKGERQEQLTYEQKSEILNKLREINPDLFINLSDDVIIDLLGAGLGGELIEKASQAPTLGLSQGSATSSQGSTYVSTYDVTERPDLRNLINQIRNRIRASVDRVIEQREAEGNEIILITEEDINDIIEGEMDRTHREAGLPKVINMSDKDVDDLVNEFIIANPRLRQAVKRRRTGDNFKRTLGGRRGAHYKSRKVSNKKYRNTKRRTRGRK